MSQQGGYEELGDWQYLWREITRRMPKPLSSIPFMAHVWISIILLGCSGIWAELVKLYLQTQNASQSAVITALCTFFMALIGSTAFRMILDSKGRSYRIFASVGYVFQYLGIFGVILIVVIDYNEISPSTTSWIIAITFSVIAVLLWWFASADDPTYKSIESDIPAGGSTDREIKDAEDTGEFKQ